MDLCQELDPYISPKHSPNYRALSSKKKLAVTFYYLKDSGSIARQLQSYNKTAWA